MAAPAGISSAVRVRWRLGAVIESHAGGARMIRFNCVCGRLLQADPKHACSHAACPVCGRTVVVLDEAATEQPSFRKELSTTAVTSLVLAALVGVFTLAIGSIPVRTFHAYGAVLAIVTASGAVQEIHESRGRLEGSWMAWLAMAVGMLCVAWNFLSIPFMKP